MIEIKDKTNCCGCTACYNICPKSAIEMKIDDEGFKYPFVNKDKCINCNLCEKVCPILNNNLKKNTKVVLSFAIRTKNSSELKKVTSGGFFAPIARYILKDDGYVYGVIFDNKDKKIKHIVVKNNDDLIKMFGSKYVQSDLGETFTEIKKIISEKNQKVLFSGTPCQVEGLLSYLNKCNISTDNLITIDFVCHGVSSSNLWKEYVQFQEAKNHSIIKEVNFRNKTYGYHSGTMKLTFENGKEYYGSGRIDFMLKSFFSEISSRPSCYNCNFKREVHNSDFTIFDCWHASKLNDKIKDDDKGYTNLFINSNKGATLFEEVKLYYDFYPTNYLNAIKLDGIMVKNNAIPNIHRKEFYKFINEFGIEKAIRKFIPITKKDHFIEKSKNILYKLRILDLLKKIRRKHE